ncbi:MAG: relaxase/mobilization nuclease domain-containing protein [Kurthia sp.]|nr:relaxase/mobilization nuclease domain-containing protein [Candidatus Kurthia equi]
MAIIRVNTIRNGKKAIDYVLKEKKEKQNDVDRVLKASGYNVDADFAKEQISAVWDSFDVKANERIQMYHVIQSFSADELDYRKEEDIKKANAIGLELAKQLYKDRQVLVVTHGDGEGHKLHNHILVNAISAIDGRSLRDVTRTWFHISKISDGLLKKLGMQTIPKENRNSRHSKGAENWILKDNREGWKETIRAAIDNLKRKPLKNFAEFKQKMLSEHHIGVSERENTITYEIILPEEKSALNGSKRRRKVRSKKLGADYSKEVICTALEQSREVERLRQLKVVLEQLEQHPVVQQYKITKNKLARERAMRQKRFSKDVTNMSSLNDADSINLIYRQFTAQQESLDEYNLRMDLQSDENQPIIQYFLKLRAQIEPSKPIVELPEPTKPIKDPSADENVETTLNNKTLQQTIQQEQQTKSSKTQQNEIAPEIQKVADERSRSFSTYKPVESEPITIEPIDIPDKGAKPIEESTPTEQRTRKASYREIDYSKSVDKSTDVAEPTPTRPSLTKQQREEQVRRQQQEEQRLREIAQKKALEEEEKEPDDGLSL